MMHRLHTPIAVVAMAMYALLTGCSGKKNHADDVLCMIGSDSLSLRQVNRLVPDSLPSSLKIARAALELVLVKSAPREKLQSVDSALAGRISSDLAEQLSRQTTDAWSSEAARYLYNAVKIIRLTFLELRSSARVLAPQPGWPGTIPGASMPRRWRAEAGSSSSLSSCTPAWVPQ